jgi:hypothetical protein
MSQGMIPAVGARGTYIVKAPWVIDQKGEYVCHAVRSFSEIAKNNINVYDTFYKPKGISEQGYKADADAGVVIVVLRSAIGTFLYIPSSYLIGLPNGGGYAYSRRLLSIDLGALPLNLSTEALRADLITFINARFGVNPTLREVELPISEVVVPENHEALERGRKGRITEPGNTDTRYQELLKKHDAVMVENQTYVEQLIELGVIVI